jgi:hypothetical protein
MRLQLFFALILLSPFCAAQKQNVSIPANQEVEVRFSSAGSSDVTLHNPSQSTLKVEVVRADNREFVRGFGLGKSSKEKVLVESGAILILGNDSESTIEISYETSKSSFEAKTESNSVQLTFHNGSLASIPLIIPGVMNPNLSPKSDSGVELAYGQKVFFKEKGKQYLLFEVDETFKNGTVLEIQDLIKAMKKQLGI